MAAGVADSPVIVIGLSFRDRDDNVAKCTMYCAWSTPIADAWILAAAAADRMSALSSAVLSKIELSYRHEIDDPGTPALESTIERKILMLITNDDDEINGIVIPSPADNWETIGNYAGIRLDLLSPAATGFADMLLALDLRTEDNRQLGTILAAGGLAL